jgi:GDSL-like Lipase/Acylhydrolase
LRRLLSNLLLAGVAVVATLGLAELAARHVLPEWRPENGSRLFWRYDPLLGWSHQPGSEGIHEKADFAVHVVTSAQGLRDRLYPEARVPGLCRMIAVGDSFTWGFGVEDGQIWHERIEAAHPDWEILNAGVAGYATDQELLYLEKRGLAFQPDVVLLLLHPNDFLENAERGTSGYYKPRFVLHPGGELELTQMPVPHGTLEQRFDRWLHYHTYLLYRVYHPLEYLEAAQEERAHQAAAEAARERRAGRRRDPAERARRRAERLAAPNKYDVDLSLTLALLGRIDAVVREHGARFLLVSVPMSDPPRSRLAAGVQALGIPYLPLDPAFRGQRDIRFEHDAHWTPHGHEIAARAIEDFLEAQGVLRGDGSCGRSSGAASAGGVGRSGRGP